MSRKRQRRDLEDTPLKDINSKRSHYDLRHNHVRQCCSLPQYDKQPCQHKYHLRPFEHRRPGNYFGIKQALSAYQVGRKGDVCAKIKRSTDSGTRRNAHSYSINGHMARCSNSSTASGRLRTLQALKEGPSTRIAGHHKEVSRPPKFRSI